MPGRSLNKQICTDVSQVTLVTDLDNTFTGSTEGYSGIASTLSAGGNALLVTKNSGSHTFGTSKTFTITQSGTNHMLGFEVTQFAVGTNISVLCKIDGNTVATITGITSQSISIGTLSTGNHTLSFETSGPIGGNRSFTIDNIEIIYEVTTITTTCVDAVDYRYGFNGQEKDDEVSGKGNTNTAMFWEYDTRLGRRWNMDPIDKPWMTSYHAFSNKPIINIDPNGAEDDWYEEGGEVKFDENIKSQKDLKEAGINGKYLSPDKFDRNVVNAIGKDIMAQSNGWEKFMNYYENPDLGTDYFLDAATINYNDNASGLMGFFADNMTGVREGIRLTMMTADWVGQAGWTTQRNQLEHHMGMFLMADRFGPDIASTIGTLNEYRGFWINDRQSGNMWNALLGRGSTAFEWSDLRHNNEGINKWYDYNKIDRYPVLKLIPQPGTLEFEMVK